MGVAAHPLNAMSPEHTLIHSALPERDGRIISLVGFAHGLSHFYHLLLPALFPWLMAEFGLDFTAIGATMTAFFVVSGVGQALAGLIVDRYGPVRVLAGGMGCFLLAGIALFFADSYATLIAVGALAGLGNSVFHPADYTLLNRRVSPARLGHAFSIHGVAGNLGWAFAPLFLTAIASFAGWRLAALSAGLLAVPAIFLLLSNRDWLEGKPAVAASHERGTFAFLRIGTVWACFAFFFFLTLAFGAIQNYSSPLFAALYGLSRTAAAAMLSAYLFASAAGILLGGFLTRHNSQEKIITAALLLAALCAAMLATGKMPAWTLLPLMATIGFFSGTAGPSRDLLVRRAATAGFGHAAFGRIYGFVYSGLDAGLAVAPLVFGGFMDRGHYSAVLVAVAAMQCLAVVTALAVGRRA